MTDTVAGPGTPRSRAGHHGTAARRRQRGQRCRARVPHSPVLLADMIESPHIRRVCSGVRTARARGTRARRKGPGRLRACTHARRARARARGGGLRTSFSLLPLPSPPPPPHSSSLPPSLPSPPPSRSHILFGRRAGRHPAPPPAANCAASRRSPTINGPCVPEAPRPSVCGLFVPRVDGARQSTNQ